MEIRRTTCNPETMLRMNKNEIMAKGAPGCGSTRERISARVPKQRKKGSY